MRDNSQVFKTLQHIANLVTGWAVLGLGLAVLFALQAPSLNTVLSVVGMSIAVAATAGAVGFALGFLFGIPKSLQDARPEQGGGDGAAAPHVAATGEKAALRYAGNTSLEQISDWLTKILVGVTLTQLANVPTGLVGLGAFLSQPLGGFAGSDEFGVLLFLVSSIGGFFVGYLWTRLRFVLLLTESDRDAGAIGLVQESFSRSLKVERAASTQAAVESVLSDVAVAGALDEPTRSAVFERARSAVATSLAEKSVTVDLSGIDTSLTGQTVQLTVEPSTTVADFLNLLYFSISAFVDPFSYGRQWVLRDPGAKKELTELGTDFAQTSMNTGSDSRSLESVGITPGARLQAVKRHIARGK